MATINGIKKTEVQIEVSKEDLIKALAIELNVYSYLHHDRSIYYKIKEDKLYSYVDISYHGSPCYEEFFITENATTIENYKLLEQLLRVNNIRL